MSKTSSSELAQVEKLLKIAFDNHATELRLSGGVPPMLRIGEQLRQLKIQPVSAEAVAGLIRAIMPMVRIQKTFHSLVLTVLSMRRLLMYQELRYSC